MCRPGIDQKRINTWHEEYWQKNMLAKWDLKGYPWQSKPNSHISSIIVESRNHIWTSYMYLFPCKSSLNFSPLSNNQENTSLHCLLFSSKQEILCSIQTEQPCQPCLTSIRDFSNLAGCFLWSLKAVTLLSQTGMDDGHSYCRG